MARPKKSAHGEPVSPESQTTPPTAQEQIPPPEIFNADETLSCVRSAAQTITGCTENEVKNYLATADFVARQVCVQLAEHWKAVCKAARGSSKGGDSAAKVRLSAGIVIDHTNLLMMDTKVKLGFSEKHSSEAETQRDLTQFELKLDAAA